MIDSVDFAKYILIRAKEKGVAMNITKLLKMLYVCDGMMLGYGVNAIGENARAWNYGPVYPKVHKWYKSGGGADANTLSPSIKKLIEEKNYDKIVDAAFATFGDWTAGELSSWTHKPNSPWEKALERSGGKMNAIISKSDMGKYFARLING